MYNNNVAQKNGKVAFIVEMLRLVLIDHDQVPEMIKTNNGNNLEQQTLEHS